MKKPVKFLLVITTLVLCFAFAGVNMVQADEISWKNPTIYQYVNNPYVRTTIVQASELPGTYTNENGLYEPNGVSLNEGQFGGNLGLIIKGMATGRTARVCFDFPTYHYGWKGSVYKYDGEGWVKLKTTVSTIRDSADAWACANSVNNGTYALVIYYAGSSK